MIRETTNARGTEILEDFKKFVMRGNVVDLAIAVAIGLAFGAIVSSLVADIIMPIIGAITGGLDFSNYFISLSGKVQQGAAYADAKKMDAVLGYGQFLTILVNFVIVAAVLFVIIQAKNRLIKNEQPAPNLLPSFPLTTVACYSTARGRTLIRCSSSGPGIATWRGRAVPCSALSFSLMRTRC
jgi:large conductance mechanosensitive channel